MAHQACGELPERPLGGAAHPPDLGEACPPWCVVKHDQGEPFEQQIHESDATPFPVIEIERRRGLDERLIHSAIGAELAVVRYRYVGHSQEWVYIGTPDHGLDVSVESAERLLGRLATLLGDGEL